MPLSLLARLEFHPPARVLDSHPALEGAHRFGAPAVHTPPAPSPDGRYLLVRTTHRPYSYQVGMPNFPLKTEVWTLDGRALRTVYDRPLLEVQPSMRDATSPGIRSIFWRPDEPATLYLVQALDDRDPRKTVPKRDRVSLLKAPFTGEPQPFVEAECAMRASSC